MSNTKTPLLFTPFQLRGVTLKNRIVVSPMCQYSADDGFANDWHLVHLGGLAVGGSGLVFTEAAAVVPEGRISPHDLGLWKDEHIPSLARIVKFIEAQDSVPGIQLAHAGRKASLTEPWNGDRLLSPEEGGWKTLGPSPVAINDERDTPQELTKDQIMNIVAAFGAAAARAVKAGFRVIEIHGAHGYLVNSFLSPISNLRTDEYGGSFDNRMRFLLEVIDAIRKEMPGEYPLFLRISATDWIDGGWTVDDSVRLAAIVKDRGVDLIDCSTGGNVANVKIPAKPGYQVPYAAAVRKTGIPTGAVGIIVKPEQAEAILTNGEADLIFIARELLRDPHFPLRAANALGYKGIKWPVQYERADRWS